MTNDETVMDAKQVENEVSAKNILTVCDTLNQAYNTLSSMGNLSPDDTALGYAGSCGNESGLGAAGTAADMSPSAGQPPLPLPWWFGPDCEQQFDPLNQDSAGEQTHQPMGLVFDSTGEQSAMTNNSNSAVVEESPATDFAVNNNNNCQNTDHNNNDDITSNRRRAATVENSAPNFAENSPPNFREQFSLADNDNDSQGQPAADDSSSPPRPATQQPVAENLHQNSTKIADTTTNYFPEEKTMETSQKGVVVQQPPTLLISRPNEKNEALQIQAPHHEATGLAPSSVVSDTSTVTAGAPAAPLSNSSSISTPADDADLRARLKAQLEWYFSRENLAVDTYLRSQMDNDQFVPIRIVATFNMVKKLTSDYDLIVQLYRESPLVQVDEKGEKVRPVHKRCTLILREIPDGTKKEEIEALFASPKCPKVVSCEFAHNNSWYINFESDEHAQAAYVFLQKEAANIRGKAVKARIKTAPIPRIQTSAPPPRPGGVTYATQLSHVSVNSGVVMSPAESLPNGISSAAAAAAPTFVAATPGSLDGTTPHTALIFVPDAAVSPVAAPASTSTSNAAASSAPATIVAASPVLTPPWPGATPFFDLGQIFALNGFQAQGTFRPSVHTVLVPATPLAQGPMPAIAGHGRHPHYNDRGHRNRRNNNYGAGGGYTPAPNVNNNGTNPPNLPPNPSDRSSSTTATSSSFESNNRQRIGGGVAIQNGIGGGGPGVKLIHANNWPSGQNDARNYHYNPRLRHNHPPNDPSAANQHAGPPGAYRGPPGDTSTNSNNNNPPPYHRFQNSFNNNGGGSTMPRMRYPYNNNNRYQNAQHHQQGHGYRGDDAGQGGQQPPNDPRHPNADYWSSKTPNYVKDKQRNSTSPNEQQHNQLTPNQNANFVQQSGIRKGSGQSLGGAGNASSTATPLSSSLRPGHVNERRRTTGGAIPSAPTPPSQMSPPVANEFDFQPSSFPPLPAPKSDIETSASAGTATGGAKNGPNVSAAGASHITVEERNRLPSANESETSTATLVAGSGATSPKTSAVATITKNTTSSSNNDENKTFSRILTRNVESSTTATKSSWPAVGESSTAKKETTTTVEHSALPPQASWGQASKSQRTVTTADKSTTTDSLVGQRKASSSKTNHHATAAAALDDETDDEALVFSENNATSSTWNKNLKIFSAKKSSVQNGPVEDKSDSGASTVKLSYAAMAKQAVDKAPVGGIAPSTSAPKSAQTSAETPAKNSPAARPSPHNKPQQQHQTTSHNQNANNNWTANNSYNASANSSINNGPFYKRQNSNGQADSASSSENVRHSLPPTAAVATVDSTTSSSEQRRLFMGSSNTEIGQSATINSLRKYPTQTPLPRPPSAAQNVDDDSNEAIHKKSPPIATTIDAN